MMNFKFKIWYPNKKRYLHKFDGIENRLLDVTNGRLLFNCYEAVSNNEQPEYFNEEAYILLPTVFLTDRKGIEIFTEDIVSWEDFEGFGYEEVRSSGIAIVRYNTDKCRTMFFDPYSDEWYELDDFCFDCVIGNTFENPELLPESKYKEREGE